MLSQQQNANRASVLASDLTKDFFVRFLHSSPLFAFAGLSRLRDERFGEVMRRYISLIGEQIEIEHSDPMSTGISLFVDYQSPRV